MFKYRVARNQKRIGYTLISIMVLVCGASWESFLEARSARQWSQHSYEVLTVIKNLEIAILNSESGQRGYLLTGDDHYLLPYHQATARLAPLLGNLRSLTSDNKLEQSRLDPLSSLIVSKEKEMLQTINFRRALGYDAALRVVNTGVGKDFMERIDNDLAAMLTTEQSLLVR